MVPVLDHLTVALATPRTPWVTLELYASASAIGLSRTSRRGRASRGLDPAAWGLAVGGCAHSPQGCGDGWCHAAGLVLSGAAGGCVCMWGHSGVIPAIECWVGPA
jgi:hypothetical protein